MDELKWKWVYIPYLDAPDKQKESAIKAGYAKVYFKSDVDAELELLKISHYAESVDAGMLECRLRRALWLARAERANDKARIFYFAETCGVKLNIDGYSNREKRTHKNVYC